MADLQSLRETLQAYGQEHLLAFAEELDAAARERLAGQIARIDFEALSELIESHVLRKPELSLPDRIEPPEILPAQPAEPLARDRREKARQRGEEMLAEGRVAAFVVAGGQGTRLGFEGPKGCYPATPVKKKPLFQVFAEQILAASEAAGKPVPWYVMTSPANDAETRSFFRRHRYFGLAEEDVFFLAQGTMPAVDPRGRILLAGKDSLALSPDGHGGCLEAMRDSGALEDMARRGVEAISYFQVDNPLVRCLDPVFLGYHDFEGSRFSAKAIAKRSPHEKLGNFCFADGRMQVIEYSDLPEELATRTRSDGRLLFSAGSIAIHVLDRAFVEELTAGGGCLLPWHRADKKVACLDPDSGEKIEPDEPNAVKFERFVFDAMPLAEQTLVLETLREEEFSPIKNAEGEDSPATSLHDQVRRAARWLEQASVVVPRDADGQVAAAVEISPLMALSAEQLAAALREPETLQIAPGENVYLGSRFEPEGLRP
jgi:UDP-N-acetylglucosamine/UDP-N-acetylgalactosamine diphosphorylase